MRLHAGLCYASPQGMGRNPIRAHHDIRRAELGSWESGDWVRGGAAQDKQVDEAFQSAACRLLEAATNGRLTFEGDRIVRKA